MGGLLFITATRIGDAVLSTGILGRFMADLPGVPVTVACGLPAAPLFQHVPGLERVHPMVKRRGGGHWFELWRATVGRRWDAVVDLRGSALAWLLPARRRHVRVRGLGSDIRHRVVELGQSFRFQPPPAPRLWLGAGDRARAAALLPDGGPILAVGPTANWPGKEWDPHRFAAMAQAMTGPGSELAGARVAVLADGRERDRVLPVLAAVPRDRLVDLVGQDLLTAAACIERARLFVGNDTGLMHLAAAVGTPTLGLFGPTDDRIYGPWGPATAVARTTESLADLLGRPGFDPRTTGSMLDGLTVDAVAAAATDLLARTRAAA
ncbi:ADP-heptose:LPS heptosyltransferase [Stella humosa]|uniref:ADP-heptose:LPS heptosyltransferase n=1 Tax=Stella humosa TaxID=94 RepID=A0A3N1MAC7_9PROT|nr:glycosyltransferase family 9 protein [Stella humosa]ROP99709.1 ADP-heptose:LPS heptosyltransferase [Stella humosa]BBK31064.1 glycosyl transferase [Stella humosa]